MEHEFNLQVELEKYCDLDVSILARGCRELRRVFLEIGNIDPLQYVTVASVCLALYRCNYMPKDSIAVVDNEPMTEVHSRESISWLKFMEQKHNVVIQHAMNGGEVKLSDIGKVDGFCKQTNTVCEYQGCYWHDCRKCLKGNVVNSRNGMQTRI